MAQRCAQMRLVRRKCAAELRVYDGWIWSLYSLRRHRQAKNNPRRCMK